VVSISRSRDIEKLYCGDGNKAGDCNGEELRANHRPGAACGVVYGGILELLVMDQADLPG